jgi:hypothetical protein
MAVEQSAVEGPSWLSEEDADALLFTGLAVLVVVIVSYYFLWKPEVQRPAQVRAPPQPPQYPHMVRDEPDGEIGVMMASSTRRPPHMKDHLRSSCLLDGLVPFGATCACEYNFTGEEDKDQLRRDRAFVWARIKTLARIQTLSTFAPFVSPTCRGNTIIVCIPEADVHCPKLARVLVLLGIWYNLFVVVGEATSQTYEMEHVPSQILPRHRIMAAKSVMGRIAVVRQLQRVEFVLDYNVTVQEELGRFGFRVILYNKPKKTNNGTCIDTSLLGQMLLPS